MRIRTGDIHHRLIHADVTNHRAAFATHDHLAAVVREAPVKTVGITDRYNGNLPVFGERGVTTVTDRLARLDSLDGKNGRQQRAHITQLRTVERYTIQPDAQAAHVELIRSEPLDARGIAYMPDNRPFATLTQRQKTAIAQRQKTLFEGVGALLKIVYLLHRKRIKLRLVAAGKVREYRTYTYNLRALQTFDESRQFFQIEAQTVHTGVDLDVYRVIFQPFLCRSGNDLLQRCKRIDIRFEVVLEDKVHGCHLGVHDDDRQRDACTP